MAILAGTKNRFFTALAVALGTTDTGVTAFEWILGFRVIKRLAVNQHPTFGGMALRAIGTESIGVRVLVTVGTTLVSLGFKNGGRYLGLSHGNGLTFFLVALVASDLLVLASQREFGSVMVEDRGRFPFVCPVTIRASDLLRAAGQGAGVRITVTG